MVPEFIQRQFAKVVDLSLDLADVGVAVYRQNLGWLACRKHGSAEYL